MATTTVPEVTTNVPEVKKAAPVTLTASAVTKVKEIMGQQSPVPAGLRIGVVGGGCSGFSCSMQFENAGGMMDKTFEMEGLKVFVDATSVMYLNGCLVDYIETLEGAGFKFENPNVKSTCGCGSSFNVSAILVLAQILLNAASMRGFFFVCKHVQQLGGESPTQPATPPDMRVRIRRFGRLS